MRAEVVADPHQLTNQWNGVRLMMMAHDMSPTPPSLDNETISAMRSALTGYVREGSRSPVLGKALQRLSTEAHEKGISAEHLLIILKNLWSSLPEVRDIEKSVEREKLKQKIVTACIEEYYRK